jgi:hypothetical protein
MLGWPVGCATPGPSAAGAHAGSVRPGIEVLLADSAGLVHRTIPALYQLIGSLTGEVTALNTHHATLDDVFLALTGRQLRDE